MAVSHGVLLVCEAEWSLMRIMATCELCEYNWMVVQPCWTAWVTSQVFTLSRLSFTICSLGNRGSQSLGSFGRERGRGDRTKPLGAEQRG
jgi:hypothetical protein